jgi:hypothetical protein
MHWLPIVSELQREYFLQRCLIAVATMTDVPLVQIALAGLVGSMCASWRRPRPAETGTVNRDTASRFDRIPTRELLTMKRDR